MQWVCVSRKKEKCPTYCEYGNPIQAHINQLDHKYQPPNSDCVIIYLGDETGLTCLNRAGGLGTYLTDK